MNKYQYKVDGIDYTVEIEDIEGNVAKVIVNGKPIEVEMAHAVTKHPLPGTITEVKVSVGDTVKNGDTVVVLEAMKMQNNIEADHDGKVTSVLVTRGDTVMEGATLITIG